MISVEELLQFQKKATPNGTKLVWQYHGRELTQGEIDNLISEAEILEHMQLWKMMVTQAKFYARERAIQGKPEDLEKTQEFNRVIETFETFVKQISSKSHQWR